MPELREGGMDMASTEKTEKITEERKRARKESDMIRQIRAKMDLTDAKAVLKMYNKLIEDKIFETLVGYTFLEELREVVSKSGLVPEEELAAVPFQEETEEEPDLQRRLLFQKNKYQKMYEGQKLLNKKFKIALVSLVIILIGFIVINFKFEYSIFTYFTNYKANMEEELIDKYRSWEEELQQRQQQLQQSQQGQQQVDQKEGAGQNG